MEEQALELHQQTRRPDVKATLSWPPSVNRTWSQFVIPPPVEKTQERIKTHGWKGFYQWIRSETRVSGRKNPEVEAYMQEAAWKLRAAARSFRFGKDDVAAWVVFHAPTARKPDMDNRLKQIFDAAQLAALVDNDCQIADYRVTRGAPIRGGCVEVRLWRIET